MKRILAWAAALAAAVCLSGCELNSKTSKNNDSGKTDNRIVEEPYVPLTYSFTDEQKEEGWETGKPLVYSDFVMSEDFISKALENGEDGYSYTMWYGFDEDGERLNLGKNTSRLFRDCEKDLVLDAYGDAEVHEVDLANDQFYQSVKTDEYDRGVDMIERSSEYIEYYYKLPGKEAPFAHYMSFKFYFDEDGVGTLFAIIFNEDTMLYISMLNDGMLWSDEYSPVDPEGKSYQPAQLMLGVMDGDMPRTDKPMPIYTFKDGKIKSEWYMVDGTKAEEHPKSVFDDGVGYSFEDGEIVLDLKGYNKDEVYIVYDRYLKCYELHEPCWREQGEFLLLSEVRG